jgi:hypothetical protein
MGGESVEFTCCWSEVKRCSKREGMIMFEAILFDRR